MKSTAPWDQKRNGTTITAFQGEPTHSGLTFEQIVEACRSGKELPNGYKIEYDHGRRSRTRRGKLQEGRCVLISWPNRRLEKK